MAYGVYTASPKKQMESVAKSAPIYNPQVLSDMMAGLAGFQQNPSITPIQRSSLDEMQGFRDVINSAFSEIGKGARQSLVQQFGTQMKNLGASFQGRGLAGSSLAAVGQVGLEGERQRAIGDLENTLIDAQSQAIRDLSEQYSGTLSGIGDQNAQAFASLLRLIQPEVSADQVLAGLSRGGSGGSGGGRGGSSRSSGGSSTGGGRIPFGLSNFAYGFDPRRDGYIDPDNPGGPRLPSFKGGRASGGGSGGSGSGGGGGGRGTATPSSGSTPGSGSGFSGFGGGLLPTAPPPPPPPGAPSDEDGGEGEGEGEDEGPKYLFGWQKSGKSKFNPMNPVIKAGGK